MKHLDDTSVAALLSGDPAALSHFREHLGSPCEECERFLEADEALEALVGTDRVLLALAPRPDAPLDEVGFQRAWRRVRRQRKAWTIRIAAVAAALVALTVSLPFLFPGDTGLKGLARIDVELQGAVRSPDGSITRADPARPIAPGSVLLLRYHATEAGRALLLVDEGSGPEQLGAFDLSPGTHDLAAGSSLAGVQVDLGARVLRVHLVAAPGSRTPSLADALDALARPPGLSSSPETAILCVAGLTFQVAGKESPSP